MPQSICKYLRDVAPHGPVEASFTSNGNNFELSVEEDEEQAQERQHEC